MPHVVIYGCRGQRAGDDPDEAAQGDVDDDSNADSDTIDKISPKPPRLVVGGEVERLSGIRGRP